MKQADKKLKLLEAREAKIKIEKTKLEKLDYQMNVNDINKGAGDDLSVKKEVFDDRNESDKKESRKAQLEETLGPAPEFSCAFCEENFRDFLHLITHIKTHHKETNSYKLEPKNAKDPSVEKMDEKWAHLIPEERVFLKHFERILNETVTEAVAMIENPIII